MKPVLASTVLRRWNGDGGGRRWGPVSRDAPVSSGKVFGPVSGYVESHSGNMQFCGAVTAPCGAETDFSDTQFCGASSGAIEPDLENAQFDGAVASPLGFETELKDAQFCEAEAKSGFKTPRSRGLMVASSDLFAVW